MLNDEFQFVLPKTQNSVFPFRIMLVLNLRNVVMLNKRGRLQSRISTTSFIQLSPILTGKIAKYNDFTGSPTPKDIDLVDLYFLIFSVLFQAI